MMPIRLVLADDHAVVRQGVRALLERDAQFCVVGEASNGDEVEPLVERLQPDVLLLDLMMSGASATSIIRRVSSGSRPVKVVVLSMQASEVYVLDALKAGALGYVLKGATGEALSEAILRVAQGRRYLSPPLSDLVIEAYIRRSTSTAADPFDTLTARERQVLQHVAEGLSSTEIAARLVISPRTVESHRATVLRKLHLHSQTELIRYAIKQGLIKAEP